MSTGAGCYFTEVKPGQWTYWLQSWPYGDNPDGETSGPFNGFEAAYKHLHDHNANPGGYSNNPLPDGEHVHEWRQSDHGQVPNGVEVHIKVQSLGPNPDRAAVIAVVKALPEDSPVWRFIDTWGWGPVTSCGGCGEHK